MGFFTKKKKTIFKDIMKYILYASVYHFIKIIFYPDIYFLIFFLFTYVTTCVVFLVHSEKCL